MALKHQEGKDSNKVFVITITILASLCVGAFLAWVIFQMGFATILNVNSFRPNTKPELKEPVQQIQEIKEPSQFSLDEIESWQSWMKMNGLFQKISIKHQNHHQDQKSTQMKNILLWNDRNDDSSLATEEYWDGTLSPLEVAGCPVFQCQLVNRLRNSPTTSGLILSDFDAIVFRYNDLNVNDLPERRWPSQQYIFYELDSPMMSQLDAGMAKMIPPDFFNLTMSHRWDSDIVVPVGGWIEPASSEMMDENHQSSDKSKSKMIAWLVDDPKDCRPKHSWNRSQKELIDHLKEANIQVDIIRQSDCTQIESINHCDSEFSSSGNDYKNRLLCRQKVVKEYAFYFAIEEDLCLDYITEKFFSMLDHPIIPLVMDAHGNYARAAPPHSYINALDFSSVRALANYLIALNENNDLYNEYFLWKKYFKVRRHDKKGGDMDHLCNLCALLHEEKQPENMAINQRNGSYKDVSDWWIRKAGCTRLGEFRMIEEAVLFPFQI